MTVSPNADARILELLPAKQPGTLAGGMRSDDLADCAGYARGTVQDALRRLKSDGKAIGIRTRGADLRLFGPGVIWFKREVADASALHDRL